VVRTGPEPAHLGWPTADRRRCEIAATAVFGASVPMIRSAGRANTESMPTRMKRCRTRTQGVDGRTGGPPAKS
jgi:hypothetical protein